MNKPIFETYTGSPFLNNALYTIEAMGKLKSVSEITPALLLKLLKKADLPTLNKKLKSYTMLFTNNGPLFQPSEGKDELYGKLLENIFKSFESEGDYLCEISGLRFGKTFSDIYRATLVELGCDPDKPDKSINRVWWPLIGSLGSDAQGLPQARFTTSIHPICIAILQFLPLSTLLYKGKALLIDSVNHEFARAFVAENYDGIRKRIGANPAEKSIDNKSYSKGQYVLQALGELKEYELDYSTATDFNLWSYTNSGTGAACDVDRVPSALIRKLLLFYDDSHTEPELKAILSDRKRSESFLEHLETGRDWYFLYPSKNYPGVSVPFFEKYQNEIGNGARIKLLSYLAGLLDQYASERDKKDIEKTDSYQKEGKQYSEILNKVILQATREKKWDLNSHLRILDDPDQLPVRNSFYQSLKIIHYYYQKKEFTAWPNEPAKRSIVSNAVIRVAGIIESDGMSEKIQERIADEREWSHVGLNRILCQAADRLEFEEVYGMLYKNGYRQHQGLLHLLQIYFANKAKIEADESLIKGEFESYPFLTKYHDFASLYIDDYMDRKKGLQKFQDHVLDSFPSPGRDFYNWMHVVKERLTEQAKERKIELPELENLLMDEEGKENTYISQFAIRFYMYKVYYEKTSKTRKSA